MRALGIFLLVAALALPMPAWGMLDLEQETLHIPDTHETPEYRSSLVDDPGEYASVDDFRVVAAGGGTYRCAFTATSVLRQPVEEALVFLTDRETRYLEHVRATRVSDDTYEATLHPRAAGPHRAEILLRFSWGTARFSREVNFAGEFADSSMHEPDDEAYSVRLKLFPQKVYADHVTTFVYEIMHDGLPVTDLEPIDGHDMVLTAWSLGWFSTFDEFLFARSRQNLGGPEAGVSVVFEKPGSYIVFAQFRHGGKVRTVDSRVSVGSEKKTKGSPLDYDNNSFW